MNSRRGQRPIPEPKPILAVCGDTGLKEYSGRIREEFHKKLTTTQWAKVCKEMLYNESNLSSPYLLIEMMIRSTHREVKAADKGHPQSAEAQEFIDSAIHDMESTPQEVMIEAASAIPWGYAYLEILYKIRKGESTEPRLNSKHDDGRYGWRDWSPRAQESKEEWSFSDEGRLLGFWQRVQRRSEMLFTPLDRAIHFRFRGSKQNPEGFSFFRPAYTSYYYATNKRMTEAISLERDGAGLPDIQLPPEVMDPGASTELKAIRTEWENIGRKMRMDGLSSIIRPCATGTDGQSTGYDFGLISASGKNIQAYDVSIKRDQHEMLKVFLTQFLAFGISQEGSHALGDSMTSLLGYSISAINSAIDERITRSAFSRLLRLEGFHPDAWPTYTSADVEKQKLEATGAFVNQMLQAGGMAGGKDLDEWGRQQIGLEPQKGPNTDDMIADVASVPLDESVDPNAGGNGAPPPELDADDVTEEEAIGGEMLTVDEAAEELRVPRGSLMRAINGGKLPGVKIGNQFRMRRSDIEAMFAGGA